MGRKVTVFSAENIVDKRAEPVGEGEEGDDAGEMKIVPPAEMPTMAGKI
ncbi:MAG: hypothetical protein ABIW76_08280 [Fibrobacteria bacterium]